VSDSISESSGVVRVEAGELRRVEVRPGDLFVLTVARQLADAETAAIGEQWHALVGADVPLMIVEGGELAVFRPAAADQP
jgi:hypothetical protein